MSNEVIKSPNNSFAPAVKFSVKKLYVKFSGSCLKQEKMTFNHRKTIESSLNNFDPTLQICLFGAVKLTKNSGIDKYEYSGYGIGFDSKGTFSHPSRGTGVIVVVFGVDISSCAHANNKTKNILIHVEGFTQGLEDTTLYAEKIYSINFTAARKKILFKFVL